jgi:hypothetical protein
VWREDFEGQRELLLVFKADHLGEDDSRLQEVCLSDGDQVFILARNFKFLEHLSFYSSNISFTEILLQ